jgi:hypothetical protein
MFVSEPSAGSMNGFSRPHCSFEERELVVLQLTPGVGLKMNVRAAVVLRKSKGSRGNQNRIPQGRKTRVNDLEDIG